MQHARFAAEELQALRQGHRLGHSVHFFDLIGSTNDHAAELARGGAAEGTVVIADEQTAGRGRRGNSWASPPRRNLYLSVILRPSVPTDSVAQLTLVAGLATARAAGEWVARTRIKWPNDLIVDGRKVAGILTELVTRDREVETGHGRIENRKVVDFVVVGIGVNLHLTAADLPTELRDKAAGLAEFVSSPAVLSRHHFADRLLSHLEESYQQFLAHGFAPLRPAWNELSALTGRSVKIDSGGRLQEGVVLGIYDDGVLRLQAPDGSEVAVVGGDVTVLDGYPSPRS